MNEFQAKVEQRAYALYLERGSKPGHAMEDWIRAEKEIKEHYISQRRAENASQFEGKASMQTQPQESGKQELRGVKKKVKTQEALLFSSGKQQVRSALK